ncbi:MAG: Holliday junction resolvase RuvX [Lachnospiraceae bacterium]|nr:Holliday junction resolvase RuvX [Lachnospiraceae bacterium]
MKRILGLDYGTKTVGVAVSDELFLTAQGLETITRKDENKLRKTLARIEELIREYEIDEIVLGYPKNMDNSVGDRGKATEEFRDRLEKRFGLPVILWDERLTTMESERILMDGGIRRENRKSRIDWMAASLILQSYMDAVREKE